MANEAGRDRSKRSCPPYFQKSFDSLFEELTMKDYKNVKIPDDNLADVVAGIILVILAIAFYLITPP